MKLLFLDTETGGLTPKTHSLLEVGMICFDEGKIVDATEFTIKEETYQVSPYALKFNGLDLYEDIYKNGLIIPDAAQAIIKFVTKNFDGARAVLVGHNPSIDKYMVQELFNKCSFNMDDYISHRMIDTMSLIWGLHLAGKLPQKACSSDGAFEYFNIEVDKRHRALSDCYATVKLFQNLIEML